jgi:hypothetical protein
MVDNKLAFEAVTLIYNRNIGSGRCWIQVIDHAGHGAGYIKPSFREDYGDWTGECIYNVPLDEGKRYIFNEAGDTEDNTYRVIVKDNELEIV